MFQQAARSCTKCWWMVTKRPCCARRRARLCNRWRPAWHLLHTMLRWGGHPRRALFTPGLVLSAAQCHEVVATCSPLQRVEKFWPLPAIVSAASCTVSMLGGGLQRIQLVLFIPRDGACRSFEGQKPTLEPQGFPDLSWAPADCWRCWLATGHSPATCQCCTCGHMFLAGLFCFPVQSTIYNFVSRGVTRNHEPKPSSKPARRTPDKMLTFRPHLQTLHIQT